MEEIELGQVPLVGPELSSTLPSLVRKRTGTTVPFTVTDLGGDQETSDKFRAERSRALSTNCSSWKRLFLFSAASIALLLIADFLRERPHVLYNRLWEYRWERMNKRMRPNEPNAALDTVLVTRREVLDMRHHGDRREQWLVQNHLDLLEQDMGPNSTTPPSLQHDKTVVLLWSGTYPVWLAKVQMGEVRNCNIPCEWTRDQHYNVKHANTKVTALACMLYGKDLCRDITAETLRSVEMDIAGLPILGISWENDWKGGYDYNEKPAGMDESIPSQLDRLQKHVPYNLVSSHELDSHIPILYDSIADFIDHYTVVSMKELLQQQQQQSKIDSVFFAISNCQAPIRPDRLGFIRALHPYYPTSSFGKCLGSYHNRKQEWNSRGNRGSDRTFVEMAKYRFVYAAENSYGRDYVTEKVYYALQSGSVPIYLGAPNVAAFLPDRNAVIYASDYDTPQALGAYLQELSRNHSLLVERHLSWRTRSLPDHLMRLSRLVDRKSDYSFACKVCNCVRGRIGCPTLL